MIQAKQHAKEARFINFLRNSGINFQDCHEDYKLGIDIILNDKPYDLKVSNKRKLTVVKRYNYNWYSPLESHPGVDYLIVEEHSDKFVLFKLTKAQVWNEYLEHPDLSIYIGDGNINICQSIDRLLGVVGPEMIIHKEKYERTGTSTI